MERQVADPWKKKQEEDKVDPKKKNEPVGETILRGGSPIDRGKYAYRISPGF